MEVLDFAGPFEVFAVTGADDARPFRVKTVSETGELVSARNDLLVQPDHNFADAPRFDIVIVPGGRGTRREINNPSVIEWIRERSHDVEILASVCTGALLLAKAGLLDGKIATTHAASLDGLKQGFPDVTVSRDAKYVDEGRIVTSAGISSGINMSLHLVARLLGMDVARATARHMEFDADFD